MSLYNVAEEPLIQHEMPDKTWHHSCIFLVLKR